MGPQARWDGDTYPAKYAAWQEAANAEAEAWEAIERTAHMMAVSTKLGIPTRSQPTVARELRGRLKDLQALSTRTHETGVTQAIARDAGPPRDTAWMRGAEGVRPGRIR